MGTSHDDEDEDETETEEEGENKSSDVSDRAKIAVRKDDGTDWTTTTHQRLAVEPLLEIVEVHRRAVRDVVLDALERRLEERLRGRADDDGDGRVALRVAGMETDDFPTTRAP